MQEKENIVETMDKFTMKVNFPPPEITDDA